MAATQQGHLKSKRLQSPLYFRVSPVTIQMQRQGGIRTAEPRSGDLDVVQCLVEIIV